MRTYLYTNMTSFGNFLLYFLISAHIVKCDLDSLFQRCCALGRNKSLESLKCESKIRTPIPQVAVEQQGICLSIVDLCCIQFVREIACESGKQAAKQNKNCNIQRRTDDDIDYKYCCESCKLGMMTKSMSMDCKSRNFHFLNPWQESYESCCAEYALPPIAPSSKNSAQADPIDICELLPGELCSQICVPVAGSYTCQCRPGFALMADGKSCQPDTLENRCEKYNICDQNCFDNGENIECSCKGGYELLADNRTCVDINECNLKIDNCYNSGQECKNTVGGYQCVGKPTGANESRARVPIDCLVGYRYDTGSGQCHDIDECRERSPCDKAKETCLNTLGSYRCELKETNRTPPPQPPTQSPVKCGIGFLLDKQTRRCVDYNECEEDPCSSHEICENLVGSFSCKCKVGFQRDHVTGACIDINECQQRRHNCDPTQRCDNTIGSYLCIRVSPCGTGYTLNSETGTCEDDDECALETDNCKKLGPGLECRNILGSFRCEKKRCESVGNFNCTAVIGVECPRGYESVNGVCTDIDECKRKNLCRHDQTCSNTEGGYKCISKPSCNLAGWRYNADQTICVDINECAEQPTVCDHKCINTPGSFQCGCNDGYFLHNDSRSCIDVNECEIFKRQRPCMGFCANTPGSYRCQCPDGYLLEANNVTCKDVDECATRTVCNKPDEICVNTRGSYRCNTNTCPANYQHDAAQKNRCSRVFNFCILNPNCAQMPIAYTSYYQSIPSYVEFPATGRYELFRLRGLTSSSTTATQFSMEVKYVHAPQGVQKIDKDYFRLDHTSANEVSLALLRPVQGPQDVEVHFKTQYITNGAFNGFTISKLFIYVSPYDF